MRHCQRLARLHHPLYNCIAAHKLDPKPLDVGKAQLDATLEKLRNLQRKPKTSSYAQEPIRAEADLTQELTAAQRGAIGDHVRRCWSTDPADPGLDKMQVLITATVDPEGIVRRAVVAEEDIGRISADARLRLFAARAVRTLFDPNCSSLPLPPSMLGRINTLTFRFRP